MQLESAIMRRPRVDQAHLDMAHQMCHLQTAVIAEETRVFRELPISTLLLGEHADAGSCGVSALEPPARSVPPAMHDGVMAFCVWRRTAACETGGCP